MPASESADPIVSRFAPAPTGYLHLGHVVNALYVWGVTGALGGRVLLRIEDHDRQRSRPGFEQAILDDLDWLGFVPDEPPTSAFRAGGCLGRQSDRGDIYEAALADLRARGLTYACDCSRADLEGAAAATGLDQEELRYPGSCAARGLPERPGLGIRVRLARSEEQFVDLRHGLQRQVPADQCGDVLVRDRVGNWTYQFAAAVDDFRQQITLVVRGDDLLRSTGRQLQLARLAGRSTPLRFLHHALVMKNATQKLSKSDRDTSVGDLRRAGWSASDVIGQAASLARLIPSRRPLPPSAAPDLLRDVVLS
jgi:glutamyl-tRNA synthetase/glutamyl-Q tRNA(Asp) synthetase